MPGDSMKLHPKREEGNDMANYIAVARSNYFKVKDQAAFEEEARLYNLTVREAVRDQGQGSVMIHPDQDGDCGGWPGFIWDDELEEDIEFDLHGWLAGHLVDGEVAVLEEVGFEKLRYLVGVAVAVNSRGETRSVQLGDIQELALQLGDSVTDTSY